MEVERDGSANLILKVPLGRHSYKFVIDDKYVRSSSAAQQLCQKRTGQGTGSDLELTAATSSDSYAAGGPAKRLQSIGMSTET